MEEHTEGFDVGGSATVVTGDDDRDGMESWRVQTALLEQDILSATGALPVATDEKSDADSEYPMEAAS